MELSVETPSHSLVGEVFKALGLPEDGRARRWFGGSAFCVLVEVILNAAGALTLEYPWWNARVP
ncbi:MAG: hypothetical protein A2Z30_08100 [Chloroflexi bacterium RBG_16_64_43]|nr:MAG: hypothetical protein A2Z30_08100 [Chloroflexi bacterium RBG_16_64_43]